LRLSIILAAALLTYSFLSGCSGEPRKGSLGPYPEELAAILGRGLVALPRTPSQVFLSWRLLPADSEGLRFRIHRKELSKTGAAFEPIAETDRTFYLDTSVEERRNYVYVLRSAQDVESKPLSDEVTVSPLSDHKQAAIVLELGEPYKQARVTTGDLDCDGEREFVVGYSNFKNVDPFEDAWVRSQDTVKVAAFRRTGERLWRIDLGWGIEAGGVYSPIVVWDIDADGCAEVLLKTNASGDRLDHDADRLTVLNGRTGKVSNETKWPSAEELGDNYNSNSRNYLAVAHLDGKQPYIIAARGLYRAQRIWAFDNQLRHVWERLVGLDTYRPETLWGRIKKQWRRRNTMQYLWARLRGVHTPESGRGSHSLPIADLNGDGKEEILWGEHCIGENGVDLWVVERPYRGHPDIVFPADIRPDIPGLETFYCREGWGGKNIGMLLVDSQGKTLWAHWGYTHIDTGWVAKIDAQQKGMQCFGVDIKEKEWSDQKATYVNETTFLWDSDGKTLGAPPSSWVRSRPVDWDGDGVKELCLKGGHVQKYNGPTLASLGSGCSWGADLFGDHREEIVSTPGDGNIYIFFNTDPLESPPRVTPLANRQYRNDLSRTAMQFNVVPTEVIHP
jgi:hypothetical protein